MLLEMWCSYSVFEESELGSRISNLFLERMVRCFVSFCEEFLQCDLQWYSYPFFNEFYKRLNSLLSQTSSSLVESLVCWFKEFLSMKCVG